MKEQTKRNDDNPEDDDEYFPAVRLLPFMGYSARHDLDHTGSMKLCGSVKKWLIRGLFLVYLGVCFGWMVLFSICVFSYEIKRFAKELATGMGRESDIIIKILNNVPWVATMARNIAVLSLYFYQWTNICRLSERLQNLLYLFFEPGEQSRRSLVGTSKRMLLVSWIIVLVIFFMSLLHYFHPDLGDILTTQWDFDPFPMKLKGLQLTFCLTAFTFLPFALAQVVLISYVGTAAGGLLLLKRLNQKLKALRKPKPQLLLDSSPAYGEHSLQNVERTPLGTYRLIHFQITNYIEGVTKAASLTLLCALGADFIAAIGYVGLVIGKSDSTDSVFPQYSRVYNITASMCWIGFFLCGQYWPLIFLPEEAEKTHHHLQGISFNPDIAASKHEQAEKELSYFLLATKHTYIGIVAGKILMFSRHMSVTITTLLLSYAVLVYELVHRDRTATSHVIEGQKNVTKLVAAFIDSNTTRSAINRSLH